MKLFILIGLLVSLSLNAQIRDPAGCAQEAVRAAIVDARAYTNGDKITYHSVSDVYQSDRNTTKYDVNLLRWKDNDSFGLSYQVITKGKKPNCKVTNIELAEEE